MTLATNQLLKRHPIRGAIWGLILGIGVAGYLVIFAIIAVGTLTPIVVIALFVVLGVLWGLFAPPRKPKGPAPSTPPRPPDPADPEPAPEPGSHFDEPGRGDAESGDESTAGGLAE